MNPPKKLSLLFLLIGMTLSISALFTSAQTQMEITESEAQRFEKADKELGEIYTKLIDSLDDEGKSKLRAAQEAWRKYRDLEAVYFSDDYRGGSAEPMLYYGTKADLTEQRIMTLKKQSTPLEER